MCTVTIVPQNNNDFVLTTNRDEASNRVSLDPDFYNHENTKLLFPKDKMAGGTWIGVSEKQRVVCVLNGGFEYHKRKLSYGKSRGIIAKDVLAADAVLETVNDYDLIEVEPFTMVIADWNHGLKFMEWVWDGNQKHITQLPLEAYIWSSSTLYSPKMKAERLKWFQNFKLDHQLNAETLLRFHKTGGCGNTDFGVIMDRGFVKTTSITQVKKTDKKVSMRYENLQNSTSSSVNFNLPQTVNE
ncbi:NRDE family protein [Tamlana crocina]